MEPISVRVLAAALGRECRDERQITQITTDSRAVTPGCLFVCIEGERFDGHDYAVQALADGAGYVVAHRRVEIPEQKVFYVDNTLDANMLLAGVYRRSFSPLCVGITGSVGKTTTKEFASSVLSRRWKTLKTQGNQNNEIGVPATLLQLDSTYEAMVVEMGMNAEGDIEKLTRCVRPDIAVITSVGTSHIERLGSRENILRAKMEIVSGLGDGAPLILCADNDLLASVSAPRCRLIRYAIDNPAADVRACHIVPDGDCSRFTILYDGQQIPAWIPAFGRHNVCDALAAFAVGIQAGLAVETILEGLRMFRPSGMRQNVVDCCGINIVEDCYNASPDSMKAALRAFADLPVAGRRYAVLGDMLELGDTAERAHREIGTFCADAGIDTLLTFGEYASVLADAARDAGLRDAQPFEVKEKLAEQLSGVLTAGDAVWFKASRGVQMEETIAFLYKRLSQREQQERKLNKT